MKSLQRQKDGDGLSQEKKNKKKKTVGHRTKSEQKISLNLKLYIS